MSNFDLVRHIRAAAIADVQQPAPLRAGAPVAVALGAVVCVFGFSLVGPLVSTSAARDAGIFSFLFGGTPTPAPQYRPYASRGLAPRIDAVFTARPRVVQARIHRAGKLARKRTEPIRVMAAPRTMGPHQPVTTLTDSTLRRGDAVMTASGIRVFRGALRYPYAARDFQPLAYAGQVPHRRALLAIDRVLRTPQWSAAWKPSSPVVEVPHMRRDAPAADTASRAAEMPQRS